MPKQTCELGFVHQLRQVIHFQLYELSNWPSELYIGVLEPNPAPEIAEPFIMFTFGTLTHFPRYTPFPRHKRPWSSAAQASLPTAVLA